MDTSDFYPIAVQALHALDASTAPINQERHEAIHALRDFIRAADEERERNASRTNWRTHQRELDRKAGE